MNMSLLSVKISKLVCQCQLRKYSWIVSKHRPWIWNGDTGLRTTVVTSRLWTRKSGYFLNSKTARVEDERRWKHGRRSEECSGEDWEEKKRWNWKIVTLSGLVLALVAKSGIEIGFRTDWFTVHAAKPFSDDEEDLDSRLISGSRRGSFDYGGNGNGMSKRRQFNFLADVVEKAAKAVVCIQIKDHSMIDLLHGTPVTRTNGSGFIIKEDGLILTNAHVVNESGRTAIAVLLSDGRSYAGQLEAVDPVTDLALIRIQEKGLPTLKLASSAETRLGEWVVAIGSPLSLSNSVTAGVVSNVKRGAKELGIRNNISYIQTDASITFGNSGGPLVNLDGEAIGINSMKVAAGISFAIPSDYVKQFLELTEARKKSGKPKPLRRYIGLTFLTLSPDIAADLEQRMGFPLPTKGVFVWSVVVGSPAYVAGVSPGDVIQKVNDIEVSSTKDVYDALEKSHSLQFHIIREGRKYQCKVHPKDVPPFPSSE